MTRSGDSAEPTGPAGPPEEGIAPDGRPWVHPLDRDAWRSWLIEHHATSNGVYLVGWRRATGRRTISLQDAIDEALCVGWIDSKAGRLDDERSILWFTPRRPRSQWGRANKQRVERLAAEGRMLPAGFAAIEAAKQTGSWTFLDDVEDLIVPDDLDTALAARPPARANWDAFSESARRQMLAWVVTAKRPETRASRIDEIADRAARNEKALPTSTREG